MIFDLYYGMITFIEGIIIMSGVFAIARKLRRNQIVFLTSFYNKRIKKYAFLMFFIAVFILAVNYAITTIVSLSNSNTLVWEYGNVAVFGALAAFFVIMSL